MADESEGVLQFSYDGIFVVLVGQVVAGRDVGQPAYHAMSQVFAGNDTFSLSSLCSVGSQSLLASRGIPCCRI